LAVRRLRSDPDVGRTEAGCRIAFADAFDNLRAGFTEFAAPSGVDPVQDRVAQPERHDE
jgi:hypothetical protein